VDAEDRLLAHIGVGDGVERLRRQIDHRRGIDADIVGIIVALLG
jgi:hypothetical protein